MTPREQSFVQDVKEMSARAQEERDRQSGFPAPQVLWLGESGSATAAAPAGAITETPREWFRQFLDTLRYYNREGSTPEAMQKILELYLAAYATGWKNRPADPSDDLVDARAAIGGLTKTIDQLKAQLHDQKELKTRPAVLAVGRSYKTTSGKSVEIKFINPLLDMITYCVEGYAASDSCDTKTFLDMIDPAPEGARVKESTPRYEYKVVYISETRDEDERVNEIAQEGWRLITVNDQTYYFERLKAQEVR